MLRFLAYAYFLGSLLGCSPSLLHYNIPPSSHALIGVSQVYVDTFKGQNASFLTTLFVQELNKVNTFDHLRDYPETSTEAVILSAEVLVYSRRDQELTYEKEKVSLIQRDRWQRPKNSSQRIRHRVHDFVITPYKQRAIHRTLDLQVRMKLTTPNQKTIYNQIEKVSFQQSYIGEEAMLLMPLAEDEMERLGRLLAQRFFDKLNPSLVKKRMQLESGSTEAWFGFEWPHPQISKGNRYAALGEYEQAIKAWNYVLFEPGNVSDNNVFTFHEEAYEMLKKERLPEPVLKPLLKLHGQTFDVETFDDMLQEHLKTAEYQEYGALIKKVTRITDFDEKQNFAAAHYNLGVLHRLRNELKLAGYHFAQANHHVPNERYAQAWTDVQHEMGTFNPLDENSGSTIRSAASNIPPREAMIQVRAEPEGKARAATIEADNSLQPVELPGLSTVPESP